MTGRCAGPVGPGGSTGAELRPLGPVAALLVLLLALPALVQGTHASPAPGAPTYDAVVLADAPSSYWRFDETTGTTVADRGAAPAHPLTRDDSVTLGAGGAVAGDTAATFAGGAFVGTTTGGAAEPAPQVFTVEAWVRTTSTRGGRILGSAGGATGSQGGDRHLYLTNDGRVGFGVWSPGINQVQSRATVNDGEWHHLVVTLGGGALTLHVDGTAVDRRSGVTSAEGRTGFWRVGGGSFGGYAATADAQLAGSLDEIAVYPTALSAERIAAHYTASGRSLATAPADRYGAAVHADGPDSYWRFGETTGTRAVSSGPVGVAGTRSGTPVLGAPGLRSGPGLGLDSAGDLVTSQLAENDLRTFSLELWFQTRTTQGGRLIGFGNTATGYSGNFDRAVFMTDAGQLVFGVYNGGPHLISSTAAYNDGGWHHVVAVHAPGRRTLYVDGAPVATSTTTSNDGYTGFWRVGGDNVWGGATSRDFVGTVDEVAIYRSVLPAADVAQHHRLGTAPAGVPPSASFTSSTTERTVSVDASASSADPLGALTSYAWTFGDGSTATGPTASHTYASAGTRSVTLTVTDDEGATSSTTRTVAVNSTPRAAFTTTVTDLDVRVDASTSADDDGDLLAHSWAFGDGATASGPTASHRYATAGPHTVTLTVQDARGATRTTSAVVTTTLPNTAPSAAFTTTVDDLRVVLDGTGSTDSDGSLTRHAWTFGDGGTATGEQVEHTFGEEGTYDVTLEVTDDRGGRSSTTRQVVVTPNRSPSAVFTTSLTDLSLAVDASGSADPDGDDVELSWDFGDGSGPVSGVTAAHEYEGPGTYEVALTVTDDDGGRTTELETVVVTGPNRPPTPHVRSTATGRSVVFDASGSADDDGAVVDHAWDFGDGSGVVRAVTTTHTYEAAGSYQVSLTVTDDDGATETVITAVSVNTTPTAVFTTAVDALEITVDASSSADGDGDPLTVTWDFGDGSAGSGPTATHSYAAPGTYTATLTVADPHGGTATLAVPVTVQRPVVGPPVVRPPVAQPPAVRPPVLQPPAGPLTDRPPAADPPVVADPPVAEPRLEPPADPAGPPVLPRPPAEPSVTPPPTAPQAPPPVSRPSEVAQLGVAAQPTAGAVGPPVVQFAARGSLEPRRDAPRSLEALLRALGGTALAAGVSPLQLVGPGAPATGPGTEAPSPTATTPRSRERTSPGEEQAPRGSGGAQGPDHRDRGEDAPAQDGAATTGGGWTLPGPGSVVLTSQQVAVGAGGSVGVLALVAVLALGHGTVPHRLAGPAKALGKLLLRRPGPR